MAPDSSRPNVRRQWVPSGVDGSSLSVILHDRHARLSGLPGPRPRYRLQLERPGAAPRIVLETTADVTCPDVPLGSGDFLCVASERGQTRVWAIPAGSDEVQPLLWIRGRREGESPRLWPRPGRSVRTAEWLGFWLDGPPDQDEQTAVLVHPGRAVGLRLGRQASAAEGHIALGAGTVALAPRQAAAGATLTIVSIDPLR
jgi:hypothetical protein